MTAMSTASTLGDSWNRIPSFSPRPLSMAGMPRGNVLVVIDDAIVALDLQRMLSEGGWRPIGPATTVAEVQHLLQRKSVACAVLDLDIDRRTPLPTADLLAFVDVPFVYLTTGAHGPAPSRHRRWPVVVKPFTDASMLAAVEKAVSDRRQAAYRGCGPNTGAVVPSTRIYPPL